MKLSILCRAAALAALALAVSMLAQTERRQNRQTRRDQRAAPPVGYVQVTAANLTDSSGVPVANATIAFAPVNNSGQPISYQINGSGQAISTPVTTLVTNGGYQTNLADTALTIPVNVCFSVTVTDNISGKPLLGPGYTCFQPAGSGSQVASGMCTAATSSAGGTCSFDKFQPNLPGLVVQQTGPPGPQGPQGPATVTVGTTTTGAAGSAASVVNAGTPSNTVLNFTVPQGIQGPPGGSLSYPGVVSDTNNGLQVTGNVAAATTASSVNKVINVMAPPYNAKCDGVTDDQAAIQAAFNAAGGAYAIQFPAGTCLTSTITWKGQSFFGAGENASIIRGKPGQDVFATPDGNVPNWNPPSWGVMVRDLQVQVDNTIDVSSDPNNPAATHAAGFANRIAGTLGTSGALGSAPTPISPPFGAGNVVFGTGSTCSGSISFTTPTTLTLSGCPSLTTLESWRTTGNGGAPVVVNGQGAGGGNLNATISAVTSNTITLSAPAQNLSVGANAVSGNFLSTAPITPPWYVGNCAFAVPSSDGAHRTPTLVRWTWRNVTILNVNGPTNGNHTCGFFIQASDQSAHWEKIQITSMWYGLVEAYPAANKGSTTWTGDTTSFKDIDIMLNVIPFVIMGGAHRTLDGLNVYGGSPAQGLGPMFLDPSSSFDLRNVYFECYSPNGGELTRYSAYGLNLHNASPDQCSGSHYVLWNATRGVSDGQFTTLQIAPGANSNVFTHTNLNPAALTDNGYGNSVESSYSTEYYPNLAVGRTQALNRPKDALGRLNDSFLQNGNSATPYPNASDLFTTCNDWGMNGLTTIGTCTQDPTGTEVSQSYFRSATNNGNWDLNAGGTNNSWMAQQRAFGVNVPIIKTAVYTLVRCVGAGCTMTGNFYLRTSANYYSFTLPISVTSAWTLVSTTVDFALQASQGHINVGDVLIPGFSGITNSGTNYDIAFIALQPLNQDQLGGLKVADATGAGITTGPTTVVSGNVPVFDGTTGKIKDSGGPPGGNAAVPAWLQFFGDGSEGALTCATGTCSVSAGEHWYSTCSVSAGATVFASASNGSAPLVIRCSISATIAGTVSYSANSGSTGQGASTSNYGGAGAGGGYGAANGTAGGGVNGNAGGAAGTSGNPGGNGTAQAASVQKLFTALGHAFVGGATCGGGSGGGGGSSGGAGGRGGGCVVITSPAINFTGSCDVTGVNGGAGGTATGGGGGGGGGICILRSPQMTNTGTFLVTGGSGGTATGGTGTNGGAGATGWSKVFSN